MSNFCMFSFQRMNYVELTWIIECKTCPKNNTQVLTLQAASPMPSRGRKGRSGPSGQAL